MFVRRATTTAVCAGIVAATLLGAQAAASNGAHRSLERAGKVSGWTQLSAGPVGTVLSQPAALQTGSGMQAIWYQDDGAKESIRSRIVSGSGKVASPVVNVVTGWNGLIDDPKIINHGAQRMVVFAGIPANLGSPLNGPLIYATSSKGTSWVVNTSNSLSETKYAYASYGTAALDNGGSPFVGVFASSSTYMTLHDGISPGIPASSGDFTTTKGLGCCAYDAGLGKDTTNGSIWAVWYSNASANNQNGILAQRVSPSLGSWMQAPGSSIKGNSLDPGQDVAVASRRGGGVWAAYKVGYPTANKIRLWHVGTKQGFLIKGKDVRHITLTPGLNGRLWLAWTDGRPSVHVTRTNPAVTRIGAVRTLKVPTKRGSYPSVYSIGSTPGWAEPSTCC